VFINDKLEDLIPRWLLFIRGVVDSDDFPLNVGREISQQARPLRIIKQRLVKKSIDMMSDLARSNVTAYDSFCKYQEVTSLPDYVERMPDDQPAIYYAVGEMRAQAAMSPTLEKLKEKNYEIFIHQ
jgi:heat shock protein beta